MNKQSGAANQLDPHHPESQRNSRKAVESSSYKGRRYRRALANLIEKQRGKKSHATGTTPHFQMWMADLKMKSVLQRARTSWIADREEDPKVAAAFACLATESRQFKTLWDVTQASREEVLAVKGIGPAKLATIAAYLDSHQISCKWARENVGPAE